MRTQFLKWRHRFSHRSLRTKPLHNLPRRRRRRFIQSMLRITKELSRKAKAEITRCSRQQQNEFTMRCAIIAICAWVVCGCTRPDNQNSKATAAPAPLTNLQPTYSIDAPNNRGIVTQNQHGDNTIVNPFNPAPGRLYQGTTQVGDLQGASVDEANGVVRFQGKHFSAFPDPSKPLQYENLLLDCGDIPIKPPNSVIGTISVVSAGGPPCKIVGHVTR